MAASRPVSAAQIYGAAMVEMLADRLRDTKDPAEKRKLRLRMKLLRDYFRRDIVPDAATRRRAGYGPKDPGPWAPLAAILKAAMLPLLRPKPPAKKRRR